MVVEDSRYGVQAARAAGMDVLGYAGGVTAADVLEGPRTVVFDDMRSLPELLGVNTTLGHTGLPVTRIGLGLAALGRPGYINLGHAADLAGHTDVASMERGAHAVLDAAYAGGVRYFDAARSYGKAEAFLASWLAQRGLGRDDVTVGSKWGYTLHGGLAHRRRGARSQGPERGEVPAPAGRDPRAAGRPPAPVPDPLRDARQRRARGPRGARRPRGLAGHGRVHRAEHERTGSGARRSSGPSRWAAFDSVQSTWNLLERSAGPALAAAHAAGMGVIIKEALANGRLTDRGDVPALIAAAREAGTTADALALAGVLAEPWVNVVLSGATTVPELQSNLTAIGLEVDVTRFDGLVEDADTYWKQRAELPWN